MHINEISSKIIKAAIHIHKQLGPGLLESVYQACMVIELKQLGLAVESEIACPVVYRGQQIDDKGFRIDLLVEEAVIVELKSVDNVKNIHKKQLLTYLKLMDKSLGLLINFNQTLLKDGISRIVNELSEN